MMDWAPIFDWIMGMAPWAGYALAFLGGLVVFGTFVDQIIPDEKDGGFMKKLFSIPILGSFLEAVARFSPFNVKEKPFDFKAENKKADKKE